MGYYTEVLWSIRITRVRWIALLKLKYWFGSIWDIGFELEEFYKSSAHDANKSQSRGYGYHTFCDNCRISIEKSLQLPNVEGKLNSKRNNTPSKHIANSLNKFVNNFKSLEKTKMSLAKKIFNISCSNAL